MAWGRIDLRTHAYMNLISSGPKSFQKGATTVQIEWPGGISIPNKISHATKSLTHTSNGPHQRSKDINIIIEHSIGDPVQNEGPNKQHMNDTFK
jgi:hypothetical protein